jgi:hypothetical protein
VQARSCDDLRTDVSQGQLPTGLDPLFTEDQAGSPSAKRLHPLLAYTYQQRLAACFAAEPTQKWGEGSGPAGEAALFFFVKIPVALEYPLMRPEFAPPYPFLADVEERRRAKTLFERWMQWTGWDDPPSSAGTDEQASYPEVLQKPSEGFLPFSALALTCEELAAQQPSTRLGLTLLRLLRRDAKCSGAVPAVFYESALAGTTEAAVSNVPRG